MATLVYSLGGIQKQHVCAPGLDALTFGLQHIHDELARVGRVPTQVLVAGAVMEPSPDLVAAYVAEHPRHDLTITIESAPVGQVVQETARSAVDYLDLLRERVPPLAQQLYSGPLSQGDTLPHLLDGLGWITDYLLTGFPLLNENLRHQEQALLLVRRWRQATDCLASVISAYDFTLLADILLDEILPVVSAIRQATMAAIGAGGSDG